MKKDILFIIFLGILFTCIMPFYISGKGGGDFLAYWSAANLFVNGDNPYSQTEMSSLQAQIDPERFSDTGELINTWNPPWLILILAPIGAFPYSIANILWVFCNTFLIGSALIITWKLCMGDKKSKGILFVYLACFLFLETLSYLAIGQITSLLLLGIVLTIWFLTNEMDFLAGITLLVTTIKPHISYFFILLVLIWVIQNRRWKVIVGLVSFALISMVIFWLAIPNWLSNYIYLVRNLPFNQLYTSTFGSFISGIFNISIFKYSAILLIFAIKPILQVVKNENWLTGANIALLISIPLSPYGFNFDHIVILPAIVQLISWAALNEIPKKMSILIAMVLIVINVIVGFMISSKGLENYWYFWIPIPLLVVYLIAWKRKNAS